MDTVEQRYVKPLVHVKAAPGVPPYMTRGRVYRCKCGRTINLGPRAGKCPPEAPGLRPAGGLEWTEIQL